MRIGIAREGPAAFALNRIILSLLCAFGFACQHTITASLHLLMSNLGSAAPPPATYRHLDNAGDIIAAAFVSVSRQDEDGSILSSEPASAAPPTTSSAVAPRHETGDTAFRGTALTMEDVHALVTALLREFQGHERSLGRDITPVVELVSFSASKMIGITAIDSAGSSIDLDSPGPGSDIKVRLERDGAAAYAPTGCKPTVASVTVTLKSLLYPTKVAPPLRNGISHIVRTLATNGGYLPSAHRITGLPADGKLGQGEKRTVTMVRGESGAGRRPSPRTGYRGSFSAHL